MKETSKYHPFLELINLLVLFERLCLLGEGGFWTFYGIVKLGQAKNE
jgi:hypothetical protein